MKKDFLVKTLRTLADHIEKGDCTKEDWKTLSMTVGMIADSESQDINDLKSAYGYLSKKVESLEKD